MSSQSQSGGKARDRFKSNNSSQHNSGRFSSLSNAKKRISGEHDRFDPRCPSSLISHAHARLLARLPPPEFPLPMDEKGAPCDTLRNISCLWLRYEVFPPFFMQACFDYRCADGSDRGHSRAALPAALEVQGRSLRTS